MSVRALDKNGDWTFGRSKAQLLTKTDEVKQNIATRIKSFKNDWFLDVDAEIDWFNILSIKNNKSVIISEIERVTLATKNVKQVLNVEIVNVKGRSATIKVEALDIWDIRFLEEIAL